MAPQRLGRFGTLDRCGQSTGRHRRRGAETLAQRLERKALLNLTDPTCAVRSHPPAEYGRGDAIGWGRSHVRIWG